MASLLFVECFAGGSWIHKILRLSPSGQSSGNLDGRQGCCEAVDIEQWERICDCQGQLAEKLEQLLEAPGKTARILIVFVSFDTILCNFWGNQKSR